MSEITSPVVQYTGSKWRLAKWVIKHFPSHQGYAEPYCGAASILFCKTPAPLEIINDLNGAAINFFDVLRDRTDELIRAVNLTPYSRAELIRAHQPCDDPLEWARRYYVMGWQKFGGIKEGHEGGWRYGKPDDRRSPLEEWLKRSQSLTHFASRLKEVYIESDLAVDVIRRHDDPKTLMFCDPPYVSETCTEDAYANAMSNEDHRELSKTLHAIEGMAIISGYPSELYNDLYHDWKMVSKGSYTIGTVARTECLWISPNAQRQTAQKRLF